MQYRGIGLIAFALPLLQPVLGAEGITGLINTFNEYWGYRWAHFYPPLCQGTIRAFEEDDTGLGQSHRLIELPGFPQAGQTFCCHFPGSPLEASGDDELIGGRLAELVQRYGRSNLRFATFQGQTSLAFEEALLANGFTKEAPKPIMAITGPPKSLPLADLGPDFEARLITQPGDLWQQFVALRPPMIRHFMGAMAGEAIIHPETRYWCLVHGPSQRCVATAQVHAHGEVGHLAQMTVAPGWEGRGLTQAIAAKAIQDAYEHYLGLKTLFGDAGPVGDLGRLDAEIIGWLNAYQG